MWPGRCGGLRSLAVLSARGSAASTLPSVFKQRLPAISVRVLQAFNRDESPRPQCPPLLALLSFAGLAAALAQQPLTWNALCAPTDAALPGYAFDPATRKKYGRYLSWCRLNVDQVPHPFVNDMETTYEERGASRVTINQGGGSLGKRQATGQLCFRPMAPPPSGCTNS